uniref:Uncharacterized protein n=1 Tax=Corvus moneduloides TaxID=1196302 RepID=A0A8C3D5M3_CORMO
MSPAGHTCPPSLAAGTVPGSCRVFSPIVSPIARTVLPSGSVVVNSCSSAAEQLCNFVCDCSDCSDENQCGYLRGSAVLGTPFTCDFEDSDCGWQDVGTSTYGWVRGRASLAMWGTGPHSDHTLGTDLGKREMLSEQVLGTHTKTTATAWLRSPEMREAAATCEIRAWYHLSGSCEGTQGGHRQHRLRGIEDGRQWGGMGPSAPMAGTELPAPWGGSLASSAPGNDVGELTVSLWDQPLADMCPPTPEVGQQVCGAQESRCPHGFCLARHRFCDGTDDCGDSSDESAVQCSEHPWPSGGVLRMGWGSALVGKSCALGWQASPQFCPMHRRLVLYYHLHGSATSNLSISYVTNSTKNLMRERTGDLGSCWVRERVDFIVTVPFKVGWCCAVGSWAVSGVRNQSCIQGQHHPPSPPWPCQPMLCTSVSASPCTADEVACDSGDCIAAELACDFADTCADGSDEKRCGESQGSPGTWWWRGPGTPGLAWPGHMSALFLCPGTSLALQTGEGQMVGPAKARSPPLGPSGPACTMEMTSAPPLVPGFLAVSIADHTTGTTQLAWQTQGHGSTAGGRVRVPLGQRSRPFQVGWMHRDLGGFQWDSQGERDIQGTHLLLWCLISFHLHTVTSLWPELSCNFERDLCGWYQDLSSDFKWVRSMGQGHGSDHTTGSGYFLSVDPSVPWSHGQRAQLLTSRQEPATAPRCLSFWYRLAGPQIGTLNLKLRPEGGEDVVLWTRQGTQGSIWHRAWATLPHVPGTSEVAFEVLHDGFLGDVGLDDLAQTAGPCGAELSCSFEAGGCALAASGKGTWQRQSNGTGTTAGPATDHTTGTAAGHYMVVNTGRVSLPAGHTAALTSQPYQPSVPAQCLAFWYQLSTGTPGCWRQLGVMRGAWRLPALACHPAQVVFEAVGAGGDHGYIALDDLHVSDGACPEPASCDFEQDTCGWSSPSDPRLHSLAWGWKSGVALAKYPSPEQDHTLGTRNGHYVHFDTSVLGARGTSALLESPPLPAATDSCLRFWYHMDIAEHLSSGELRVTLHGAAGQRTVWSVAGHRSRGWQGAVVPVQSPGEFQVSGATLGWPVEGTVALDDIVYSARGGCHSSPESPVEGAWGPVPAVVLSLLLALIIVALVAAGGWYWLKPRGLASRTPAESNSPQGFDNITFRDVRTG